MTKGEFEQLHAADDHATLVNTIVLSRIYDVLLLILLELNPESAGRLEEAHAEGEFIASPPAIRFTKQDG